MYKHWLQMFGKLDSLQVCNFPRILLDIHELATFRQTLECRRAGMNAFSVWSIVVLNFSHFLGPILQNSISDEKFSDKSIPSNN
jgi:hypothetical protein